MLALFDSAKVRTSIAFTYKGEPDGPHSKDFSRWAAKGREKAILNREAKEAYLSATKPGTHTC